MENHESSNNVILFPRESIRNVPEVARLTKEQLDEHIFEKKIYVVDEILDIIIPTLYNQLACLGYPIDDSTSKDGALLIEAVKSILFKNHDLPHNLQTLAEEMFTADDNNNLTLTGNLSIMTNTNAVAVGNN